MDGRKPVPTEIKKLRGNPGKRRLPREGEEAQPEMYDELPPPPEWLGKYGVNEWNRVGPVLQKQRLLTEADLLAFTTYCLNVHVLVESAIDIEDNGMTVTGARGEVRNPALSAFTAATSAIRAFCAEFGMTPSSRGRIKLPGDDGETLEDLMNREGDDD